MATSHLPNVHHPEVMRSILEQILATGDVVCAAGPGRTILAVTAHNSLFALAAFGADLEDLEPEPSEDDAL